MKKRRVIAIGMVLALILGGCSQKRKNVDYNIDSQQVSNEASNNNAMQAGEKNLPKRLSYEEESTEKNNSLIVDADIIDDSGKASFPVASVERNDFTNEDIQRIVKCIFDEESYYLDMPYEFKSYEELLNDKDEFEKYFEEKGYTDEDMPYGVRVQKQRIEEAIASYDEADVEHYPIETDGTIKWYEYPEVSDCSVCCVSGTIDGKKYKMKFAREPYYCSLTIIATDKWFDENSCWLNDVEENSPIFSNGGENVCLHTKDEACQMANDFLYDMGYTDYGINQVYDAMSEESQDFSYGDSTEVEQTPNEMKVVDRYNIYFGRKINEIPTVYAVNYITSLNTIYSEETGYGTGYGYESVFVSVSDDGIDYFVLNNPQKVVSVSTEKASLLAYDSVQEIAKNKMLEALDGEGTRMKESINEVRLGLGRVQTGEESYSIIPLWFYFEQNDYNVAYPYKTPYVVINAIDGSAVCMQRMDLPYDVK